MLKITTSWDDGDVLDIRLAKLLLKYNIKGTFYIAKNCRQNRLSEKDILELSKKFEIGGHTLNHQNLNSLSIDEQKNEILGGNEWLKNIIGSDIKMFCYPRGIYNDDTLKMIKEEIKENIIGARTTDFGKLSIHAEKSLMPTTIQISPFPFRKISKNKFYLSKIFNPYIEKSPAFKKIGVSRFSMFSWLSLAKATFDIALKDGEIFHLWGHSWEIEKYDMWNDLEKFLKYISNKKECVYLTNNEILKNE